MHISSSSSSTTTTAPRRLFALLAATSLVASLAACNLDFAERPLAEGPGSDTRGGDADAPDAPDAADTAEPDLADAPDDTDAGDTAPADVPEDTRADADAADTEDAPPSCQPGELLCPGGLCTDASRDPLHCGGCGIACASDELCTDGACVPQPPQPCAWLDGMQYRSRLSVSAPDEAVETGYSVRFELEAVQLYLAGKIRSDGHDLAVAICHADGSVEAIDAIVDPSASVNLQQVPVWFATQRPLAGGGVDDRYWLFYGDPTLDTVEPADWGRIFLVGADFRSGGALPQSLNPLLAGTESAITPGAEGLLLATQDTGSDAALVVSAAPLPADRRFAIRHHVRIVESQLGLDDPPRAGLEGLYIGSGDAPPAPLLLPGNTESAGREIRARLYSEVGKDLYTLRYSDTAGQQHSWTGTSWVQDLANHQELDGSGQPHVLELVSDGAQWSLALRQPGGALIDQTTPVSWNSVHGANAPSLWLAWGDPFVDAYAGELVSGYVLVRRYQDPEPTVSLGPEETRP